MSKLRVAAPGDAQRKADAELRKAFDGMVCAYVLPRDGWDEADRTADNLLMELDHRIP
jgi:hypothetical protein